MERRPNQVYANSAIADAVQAGYRAICVTSPTGGGKSLIMFDRIDLSGWTTALYTDRRMLFRQISKGLESQGIQHGLRASGHDPRLLDDIQLCMIQTEATRSLKGRREIHRCKQVLIDEAHKNSGDTMTKIVEAHREL